MTSQTEDVRAIERPDQLITPEFAPLAEFAGLTASWLISSERSATSEARK
jgi:hypothetical protein